MWWRFDEYELRDGLIRPAAGARLFEYEPWHEYQRAVERPQRAGGAKRIHAPAYESLVNLAIEIEVEQSDGAWHLTQPSDEARLLDWVNAHGLLGILPHVTEAVILPIQKQGDAAYDTHGSPAVIGRRYDRDPSGDWLETNRPILPEDSLPFAERSAEELVAWRDLSDGQVLPAWASQAHEAVWPDWHRPGAILWSRLSFDDFGGGVARSWPPGGEGMELRHLVHQPFSQTWAQFFPGVATEQADAYIYPRPLSEAFWRAYAEPVYDFVGWAKTLATVVMLVESSFGQEQLSWLVRSVSPRVQLDPDRGPIAQWLSPSLIGSLAMMAVLDATEGRRPQACAACGRIFVSSAYQAQYCSTRCRERAHKQNLRHRMRQAAVLSAEGLSVAEIARRLGTDERTASGWLEKARTGQRRKRE